MTIATAIVTLYWFLMTVLIVPIACLSHCLIVLMPILMASWLFGSGNVSVFNDLEHRLCRLVNDHWVSAGKWARIRVVEYGDDIRALSQKRCLVLCNHLALLDHFVLMTAFHDKPSVTGRYMFVIYHIWKWTPLGAMWTFHGNFFINGGVSQRITLLRQFDEHLREKYWRFDYRWIVMYPEGSRLFLIQQTSNRFAEQSNLPRLTHCALPRSAAAHVVLSVCGGDLKKEKEDGSRRTNNGCLDGSSTSNGISHVERRSVEKDEERIEHIIDVTIGYSKGHVPSLDSAMLRQWSDTEVAVHYKVHRVTSEMIADENNLRRWLIERYVEKDKMLDEFYRNGQFPGSSRSIDFDTGRAVLVQLFWMVSFYLHYSIWQRSLCVFAVRMLSTMLGWP